MFSYRQRDEDYLGDDQSRGRWKRCDGLSERGLKRLNYLRRLGQLHFQRTVERNLRGYTQQIRLCFQPDEPISDGQGG
jgi:hypothetical protein